MVTLEGGRDLVLNHKLWELLATFTNPTIYDVRRDLLPLPKLPHTLYSHLICSFEQTDDSLHKGPKHVVVYYILLLCNIVVFMIVSTRLIQTVSTVSL